MKRKNKKYINQYFNNRYHSDEKFRKKVIETNKKAQKRNSIKWKKKKNLCLKCGKKKDRKDRKLCNKCRIIGRKRYYKCGEKIAYKKFEKIIDKEISFNEKFKYNQKGYATARIVLNALKDLKYKLK